MKSCGSATMIERQGEVALPLASRFMVAGSTWMISSNSEEVMKAAHETFQPAGDGAPTTDLWVSIYVDFEVPDQPRWSLPRFRALDHLYYAMYGPCDSMLIDQQRRRVVGSFSSATARDVSYWKRVILPGLLGIVSASIGVTPLHCACLVKHGHGLLVGGESEAGKSTLALSLSLNGFAYLSDDWTYFSRSGNQVCAWGLPTPVKLLPDALKYFPRLAAHEPAISQNGELAFEVDPVDTFEVSRSLSCKPRWLVFVERTQEASAVFIPIGSSEAASRFAADLEILPPPISGQREHQLATIEALVNRECWVLRHGMPPSAVARELADFCARS
jgi:hypothetical protein